MARKNKADAEDIKELTNKFEKIAYNLEETSADNFLKTNFIPYAWSYNLDRALVDVSGLKPVQRRTIYTMYENNLSPNSHHAVVANIAGAVLKYHPHGDASVQDAIKNMGRFHVMRVPLIDGGDTEYGEPGKPGGAARYLKARISKAGWLNVAEIAEKAVHMVPNYDGQANEPVKLPVRWPVSVINGGSGIAIAYAANMPSHNPTEIMKACIATLDAPEISHGELQRIILGPDFNMGGLIPASDGVKDYMETGRGTFKIRGQYEATPGPRGTTRIEFYEIPFGTSPEKILEEYQKGMEKGHFKEIANFKNLSDLKHPIRIVIDTKPASNYKKVVQDAFKYTSLETSFAANITTIVDNKPRQSSMRDLLLDFITFRKQCVENKSRFSLGKKEKRLHLIDGLLKTLLDIDKAIEIIRNSEDIAEATVELKKAFAIDDEQAEYVLSLQLRRLTKMDRNELQDEQANLNSEIDYLNSLLTDEAVLNAHLRDEFNETLKVIGDERKTEVNGLSLEELKAQEKALAQEVKNVEKNTKCYLTRFANGSLLKTMEPFTYEDNSKRFENSPIVEQLAVKTQDFVVLVTEDGIGHRIPMSYLMENNVVQFTDIGIEEAAGRKLIAIAKVTSNKNESGLLLGSKLGDAKLVKPEFPNRDSFPVYNVNDGDELVGGRWLGRTLTASSVISITSGSNVLLYPATSLRPTGAAAGGVRSQKLREGEEVVYFGWLPNLKDGDFLIASQANGTIKLTPAAAIPPKGKGSQGVNLHKFRKGEDKIINAYAGENVAASVAGFDNSIIMPPVSPRAATGMEFKMEILLGSTNTQAM